jgi:mRNA-degrading endonuclease HigB of HigAB toxin-antitoxin module
MRIISNKALVDFAHEHRATGKPLQAWRKLIESYHFANFAQLKKLMNATDRVDDFYVFDIAEIDIELSPPFISTGRCFSCGTFSRILPINAGT